MAGILANSASKSMVSGDTAVDKVVTGYARNERITLGVTPSGTTYRWALALPAGSSAAKAGLTDDTIAAPAFTPDIGGTYVLTCQVDGSTTYAMRLTALDSAVAELSEALRFTPRTRAQIATPSAGGAMFWSSDDTALAIKDSSGTTSPVATTNAGWIDILGPVDTRASGPTIPALTALSSPHANFLWPMFAIGDIWYFQGHIPHGVDVTAGIYLHCHCYIDGTQTQTIKFNFEYTYAHGYSRAALAAPTSVTVEQAGTGTAKTHQILEIATPILTNSFETDGILNVVFSRITNGGTDVTNNVFVPYVDAHVKLLKPTSTNRNYPFE